ncbi:MAG: alpha/beta hydrolase [Acidimicrobiia bacterium]
MGWLFLGVSLVGAWFTFNALFPTRRWQMLVLSFMAGWITAELAYFHLAWQFVATVVFIRLGALETWPGILGLVITLVSWAGLLFLIAVSLRSRSVVEHALRDGLGDRYRDEIAAGRAQKLATRVVRRQLVFPLLLRDHRVERIRDLRYAEGAGSRHLLDVLRPKTGVTKAPVLFQIHGGGWVIGDKSQQGLPLMLHLAAEGWVCVAANYRLSPRATWPDHLVDCKAALAWIREHIEEYGGDPDLVVVTGGSAGGHLTALVALTQNDPQFQPGFESADTSVTAAVPFYGVYEMADVFRSAQAGRIGKRIGDGFARWVLKTTPDEDPDAFWQASPLSYVDEHAPPFFVVHGTNDNLVPVEQARKFAAELRKHSREPVVYAEIPGASHAFEVFHSVRTGNVVNGVDRFLAWIYSRVNASGGASPESAGGGTEGTDPTTTARTGPR